MAVVVALGALAYYLTSDIKGYWKGKLAFRVVFFALMVIFGVIYYWNE